MSGGLFADITPLRQSPPFRRLWLGSALSSVGSQMTTFAVALQVYRLTHSSTAVGGIGLATFVPSLCFGLFGGALADAVDRRRLVLTTSSLLALVSVCFAVQAFAGNTRVWLLYLLIAVQATLSSVNGPARRTFAPRLLPPEQVPAALALGMMSMHTSLIIGPVLAGELTGIAGLKVCYLVDAVSFSAALYGVVRLPAMRPVGTVARPGLRAIAEGLAFVRDSRVLTGVLLADVSATLFAMPIALFPAINAARFHGSPRTLGLLSAGLAIGGVVGTVLSGPAGRLKRQGLGVLVAGAVWGAALVGFGLADGLALTLACLVVAGVADVTSVVLRTTITQLATPDRYRGRVGATESIVGASFPQLGNFRAGLVASATSPGASAAIGGGAAVAGAGVVAALFPALVRYRADRVSEPARR